MLCLSRSITLWRQPCPSGSLPVSSLPQGGYLADPWYFSAHILWRLFSYNSSQGLVLSDFLHFDNSNRRSYKGYSDYFIPTTFALFLGKQLLRSMQTVPSDLLLVINIFLFIILFPWSLFKETYKCSEVLPVNQVISLANVWQQRNMKQGSYSVIFWSVH